MIERWNANSPDIPIVFEINETANWIKRNKFTKVGLQFPDELLGISIVICRQLNSVVTDCLCVILGDSSFASCCVDEIAGQHMKIDALIHYGRACLSITTGCLPIYYVFGKYSPYQLNNEIQSFKQISHQLIQKIFAYSSETITPLILLIMYDFRFKDIAQYIYNELISMSSNGSGSYNPKLLPKLIWSEPYINTLDNSVIEADRKDDMNNHKNQWIRCGRLLIPYQFDLDTLNSIDNNNKHSWMMLYIGHTKESDTDLYSVYRILLCLPEIDPSKTILFDPITCDLDLTGLQLNRLLKRRTYLIEKAKDAQYIGILVVKLIYLWRMLFHK
ncbi:Diphthamide biosynthesis protein 2 [Schistosoma haematobium]|uniref:Diphthamide biosynthesis protein 2 n=1 Tax=Schistosoma haematobium TaxID=6185 RepID=A0A922IKY4_SCHHA|nr:Diphthamide biosynthesis protein 2 [Schistosoma haematobium]KAH9581841.1 Diphthamide biosynthesis protein 2 [Schistosoma haematobium]